MLHDSCQKCDRFEGSPMPQSVVLARRLSRLPGFFAPLITCGDRLRLSSCNLSAVSSVCFVIRAASIFDAVGAYLTLSTLLPMDTRQWLGKTSLYHELVDQCSRTQPAVSMYRDIHENSSFPGYNVSIAERILLSETMRNDAGGEQVHGYHGLSAS
jgi:hypothetical protein